jgi:hypothetical protein
LNSARENISWKMKERWEAVRGAFCNEAGRPS